MKEKLTVKALSIYIQPYEEKRKMLLRDNSSRNKGKDMPYYCICDSISYQ